jgi:hypothetical protein
MTMPVRVVRGIGKHFPTRRSEWIMGLTLTGIGIWVLTHPNVFALPQLSIMASYISESGWGAACLIAGLLRLTALTVNGTLYEIQELRLSQNHIARMLVAYSKFSPHVRAGMALLGCFFWFSCFFGLVAAGLMGIPIGWGVVLYAGLFLLDLSNAASATIDADKVHRDVPA